MKDYPRIIARVFDRPHLLSADKARTVADAVLAGIEGAAPARAAGPADEDAAGRLPVARSRGGVAVIPVTGTLVHKAMGAHPPSLFYTYQEVADAVMEAATDPEVKALLLAVDSPGGEASDSAWQLSELVAAAAKVKPVWAAADETMTSAAYLISAGASKIVMPPHGFVGSIGVIAMHLDKSGFNRRQGYNYTIVHAGARKADFSPHGPLSDAALAALQASVAMLYDRFVALVAARRGLDPADVRATEAAVYETAGEAIGLGLVDAEMTPAEALAALEAGDAPMQGARRVQVLQQPSHAGAAAPAGASQQPAAAAAAEAKEPSMTEPTKPGAGAPGTVENPAPPVQVQDQADQVQAAYPLAAAAIAAGAAAAERARVLAIQAAALPGHDELVAKCIAEGKSAGEAAQLILAAEKEKGPRQLERLREQGLAPAAPAAPSSTGERPNPAAEPGAEATDDELKAKWDGDPGLRAEFGEFKAYAAYARARAKGRFRVIGGKTAA
jgi:signal peptide peptidase SppA